MKKVRLITDGACSGNPGPGGYGSILKYGDHERELSGGYRRTTNNRMEIMAILEGLEALKRPCDVEVVSDSKYIVDAMHKGWPKSWAQKGWMRNKKERAKNADLWQKMLYLDGVHKLTFIWVKGHAGHEENERADQLAVEARDDFDKHIVDEVFETEENSLT